MSLERPICEFTPYEVGKITALWQSDEQFQRCNKAMRKVTALDPRANSFVMELRNDKEEKTYFEVSKRMIFACYLVSRTAYKDLVKIGEKEAADAVDSMFKRKHGRRKAA